MRPKFEPKEEFIVAYYRRGGASGSERTWAYDLAVIVVSIGLFAFGFLRDRDPFWCVIGFGLVAYRVFQLALASRKYEGVFTSIIDKYMEAITGLKGKLVDRSKCSWFRMFTGGGPGKITSEGMSQTRGTHDTHGTKTILRAWASTLHMCATALC